MRTTLKLDDEVIRAARSLARQQGRTLGEVVSMLARRGLERDSRTGDRSGFPVFDVARDAPPVTTEMVREALEDV